MIDLKSWNPWHGCRKYSEGCANCYMFVLDKAHKVPGQSTEIFRTRNFSKPLERDRKGNFKVPPEGLYRPYARLAGSLHLTPVLLEAG